MPKCLLNSVRNYKTGKHALGEQRENFGELFYSTNISETRI